MTGTRISGAGPQLPFPYEGPAELEAPLLGALRKVIDPEVALDIVDVGLVYGVRVHEGVAQVDVTMTSVACPVAGVIVADIEDELDRALPPELRIQVDLVWEPPWTPERISAAARASMGW